MVSQLVTLSRVNTIKANHARAQHCNKILFISGKQSTRIKVRSVPRSCSGRRHGLRHCEI